MDANSRPSGQHPPPPPKPDSPDTAAAQERGTAETVDAAWQSLRTRYERHLERRRIEKPGQAFSGGYLPLLEAAAAQPRLRRLYPFTSHLALVFSSCTTYSWRGVQAGSIEVVRNGRYQVRAHHPFAVLGEFDTPEEVVALVVELLPADSDPVVTMRPDEQA